MTYLSLIAFVVVMLSWAAFVIAFLTQGKKSAAPAQKREGKSIVGIVLQGAAYAIVWMIRRQYFSPLVANRNAELVIVIFTMALAISSVWFVSAAVRALGKQWSLQARVVEGHKLITEGPYRIVRNPIYTGMLGMLLATGLAVSHWIGLVLALIVYAIGTFIRVRSEERLLRETFSDEWDAYAARVPAVVPYLI